MLIGITGNIGSGKSTFCKFLSLKGFKVFNADEIGKEVLFKEARDKVVETFGREILNSEGRIDTKKLAKIVFSEPDKLELLTSITHPFIKKRISSLRKEGFNGPVFVEAAVLIEYNWQELFDSIVLVYAHKGQRLLRAARKFGLKEALRRERLQLPYGEKLKYSDFLICNTETLLHLKEQALLLLKELESCLR
ncbi:dephospho-CoA kinase [Thermovibrio sp.]